MQVIQNGLLFRVSKLEDESFNVQLEEGSSFYPVRHYHPEVQLTLIMEGSGTRFIGNSIASFEEGDLFLIGSNVPHVFRNEQQAKTDKQESRVKSLSIYFKPDALGQYILSTSLKPGIYRSFSRKHPGVSKSAVPAQEM